MEQHKEDNGLEYALKLNYTKNQYEKAISKIPPQWDHNQLLNALIDIDRSENQSLSNSTDYLDTDTASDSIISGSGSSRSITNSTISQSGQLQNNEKSDQLRTIYVDGQNVARCHGNNDRFSWMGVKLCADWFLQRGHDVFIFMPEPKCRSENEEENKIIKYLQDLKLLIPTPAGCSDDLFILEVATKNDGIVVSNDQFRDEKKNNERYSKKFVDRIRLPFTFCHDTFIPNPYPLPYGRGLDEFLKFSSDLVRSISDKSYQKNRRKWTSSKWCSPGAAQGQPSSLQPGNKPWNHQERTRLRATTSLPVGVQTIVNSRPKLMRTTSNCCGDVNFEKSSVNQISNINTEDGSVERGKSKLASIQSYDNNSTKNSQLEYYLSKLFEIVPPEIFHNVMKRLNAEDVEIDTICSKLFESL